MLDIFLEVACAREDQAQQKLAMDDLLMQLPEEDLWRLARGESTASLLKQADGEPPDQPEENSWLRKFEGTPFYERALALEQESLEQDIASAKENLEKKLHPEPDSYEASEKTRLCKRILDLELTKSQLAGSSEEPTKEAAAISVTKQQKKEALAIPAVAPSFLGRAAQTLTGSRARAMTSRIGHLENSALSARKRISQGVDAAAPNLASRMQGQNVLQARHNALTDAASKMKPGLAVEQQAVRNSRLTAGAGLGIGAAGYLAGAQGKTAAFVNPPTKNVLKRMGQLLTGSRKKSLGNRMDRVADLSSNAKHSPSVARNMEALGNAVQTLKNPKASRVAKATAAAEGAKATRILAQRMKRVKKLQVGHQILGLERKREDSGVKTTRRAAGVYAGLGTTVGGMKLLSDKLRSDARAKASQQRAARKAKAKESTVQA